MHAGFVGMGNMGTTIANLVASNGCDVTGWDYHENIVNEINNRRTNSRYLPRTPINDRVRATTRIEDVFSGARMVFVAIPSVYIKSVFTPLYGKVKKKVIIVNLTKGIDAGSGRTSFNILSGFFPGNPIVMLSGPSIANEIAARMPTVVAIAGRSKKALEAVAGMLDNEYFKTSASSDVVGVELGGILKNIYAIGLGIFDGKGVRSVNFRSVYLTMALREMTRIGMKLGARKETFASLSGLGDLFATSLSAHSHNRRLGELIAKGAAFDEVRHRMGLIPEGYNTLKAVLALARRRRFRVPLAGNLMKVIHGKLDTAAFIYSVIKEERMYYESYPGG